MDIFFKYIYIYRERDREYNKQAQTCAEINQDALFVELTKGFEAHCISSNLVMALLTNNMLTKKK